MDHYHVTLEGYPADSGDVTDKDGVVIGTYTCGENDYCEFTPNGASEPVCSGYLLGPFCKDIAKWHEGNPT